MNLSLFNSLLQSLQGPLDMFVSPLKPLRSTVGMLDDHASVPRNLIFDSATAVVEVNITLGQTSTHVVGHAVSIASTVPAPL